MQRHQKCEMSRTARCHKCINDGNAYPIIINGSQMLVSVLLNLQISAKHRARCRSCPLWKLAEKKFCCFILYHTVSAHDALPACCKRLLCSFTFSSVKPVRGTPLLACFKRNNLFCYQCRSQRSLRQQSSATTLASNLTCSSIRENVHALMAAGELVMIVANSAGIKSART